MNLFSKKESYLGVDLGANGIKLVELHKTKGRPQLWTYGVLNQSLDIHIEEKIEKTAEELLGKRSETESRKVPIMLDDPRIDRYAELLKNLIKESRVSTRQTTASLPVSYIFHAVVTLPPVDKKEIEHHVRAKVQKLLPKPIEEMQLVYEVVPLLEEEKKKYLKVLVTAAPRDLVTFYTAIFQKAGLELEELETEAFALERSLVGHDKSTSIIIDIGAERTNFFIIDQGLPVIHRSLQLAGNNIDDLLQKYFGLDISLARQLKSDMGHINQKDVPIDLFSPVLDPIVKEIRYSFDMYLHQTGNEKKQPEKLILTGGSCVFPPVLRYMKENLDMKIFVGDPWARVVYQQGLKQVLDGLGPRMAVSIGLAMRNI